MCDNTALHRETALGAVSKIQKSTLLDRCSDHQIQEMVGFFLPNKITSTIRGEFPPIKSRLQSEVSAWFSTAGVVVEPCAQRRDQNCSLSSSQSEREKNPKASIITCLQENGLSRKSQMVSSSSHNLMAQLGTGFKTSVTARYFFFSMSSALVDLDTTQRCQHSLIVRHCKPDCEFQVPCCTIQSSVTPICITCSHQGTGFP